MRNSVWDQENLLVVSNTLRYLDSVGDERVVEATKILHQHYREILEARREAIRALTEPGAALDAVVRALDCLGVVVVDDNQN